MGYRFSLESANIIANLSFGYVVECYREIFSSDQSFCIFVDFLEQFSKNLYTERKELYNEYTTKLRRLFLFDNMLEDLERQKFRNELYFENDVQSQAEKIRSIYKRLESCWANHPSIEIDKLDTWKEAEYQILDDLKELSMLFQRCKIKALLLPPLHHHSSSSFEKVSDTSLTKKNNEYEFMTSPDTLKKLVCLHPGDSCLILQPQEQAYSATAFNAFPNFDVALRQADLWPAVLFWEGAEEYAFIPIKNEDELIRLFRLARYDSHPIGVLRTIAKTKQQANQYILQLSDLHFGSIDVLSAAQRLESLVKTQLESISPPSRICTVITGDGVDSPDEGPELLLDFFSEHIKGLTGERPIRILGNHDVNTFGLAISHSSQNIANNLSGFPRIERDEKSKTILLLFNSNTNGNLAEGEIGINQRVKMENLLDGVKNISDYLLIAVLHHHVVPVPEPETYEKRWFERILPKNYLERSLRLRDADVFLNWLHQRNVRIVLHGHKHVPFYTVKDGLTIIGCGSSTGKTRNMEKEGPCLSFNWLKIDSKTITVTQVSENLKTAHLDIRTDIIDL